MLKIQENVILKSTAIAIAIHVRNVDAVWLFNIFDCKSRKKH